MSVCCCECECNGSNGSERVKGAVIAGNEAGIDHGTVVSVRQRMPRQHPSAPAVKVRRMHLYCVARRKKGQSQKENFVKLEEMHAC